MVSIAQLISLTNVPDDDEVYTLTGQVSSALDEATLDAADRYHLGELLNNLGERLRTIREENKQDRKDKKEEIADLKDQITDHQDTISELDLTVEHYMGKLDMANALIAQLRQDKERMKNSYDNLNLLFKKHMGTI